MKHLFLLSCLFFVTFVNAQSKIDSLWELDLENIVVTAQYAPTDVKNAVHEVKVIKAQTIQEQGFNNLSEVLTQQLNFRVSTDLSLGNGLKIQGIGGENVQVMIDGVPVIGRLNGNIDLSQINLNDVERIEIIEGAMSVQYGSNAAGGVINIITKKSQINRFRVTSENQYENIGIWNNSLSVGMQLDKFYASVGVQRFESQFQLDDSLRVMKEIILEDGSSYFTKKYPWNPKSQLGFNGTLRYRRNDSLNVVYQFRQFEETVRMLDEIRRPRFKPYALDDAFFTNRTDHSLSVESYLSPNIYYKSTTAYNQYDRKNQTKYVDFEEDTTGFISGEQDTTVFNSFLHRSIFSTISNKKWNGQIGFEILHETGFGGRIVDTNSTLVNGSNLTNYAAWASIRYEPTNELTIQGNLRYGYNTKYNHPWIPSINAAWNRNNTIVRLSYVHGFRAPNLKELYYEFIDINHYIIGNQNLEAERSRNAALSVNHIFKIKENHQFTVNGKLFYNSILNRITLTQFADLQYNYQNIDRFETHGFNVQLVYDWKDLSIKSGFSYTRLYNDWSDDFDAPKFINLPELQNELRYKIPFIQTNLSVTHRYIGKQVLFYENNGKLQEGYIDAFSLMNATLSRHFWKKRIFVSVGSKNLLNVQDVPFVGNTDAIHSSSGSEQLINWGRTYFLRVNVEI